MSASQFGMAVVPRVTIRGIQEAQRANLKAIAEMQPSGALGAAVKMAALKAHRYATAITHVDTGGLKASHRIYAVHGLVQRIALDPAAVNPRQGYRKPSEYGVYEHARGGTHAFYARTEAEAGALIARAAGVAIRSALP